MFCNNCGRELPDKSQFCSNCGANLSTSAPAGSPPAVPPAGVAEVVPTSGKATASLICGILSLTIFSIFTGIPAVILGHMSRGEIRRAAGRLKGDGQALAGLIMGYISLLAIPVIILLITAIAVPFYARARMETNEQAAIGVMRSLNRANANFFASNNQYAGDLQELQRAGLIESSIADGTKYGYNFNYEATDSDSDGTRDKYWIVASPVARMNRSGREFCTDETGVLRQDNPTCTPESAVLE
jgi:Tfp pilus assembly protein PilE